MDYEKITNTCTFVDKYAKCWCYKILWICV